MNDAVKEADKIVCEYLKRMGYEKDTTEKKSRRLAVRVALLLAFCILAVYVILKLML